VIGEGNDSKPRANGQVSGQLEGLIKGSLIPRPSAAWLESGQPPDDKNGRATKERYGPTFGVSKAGGNLSCEEHLFPSPPKFLPNLPNYV
jgi:hypothetical protein